MKSTLSKITYDAQSRHEQVQKLFDMSRFNAMLKAIGGNVESLSPNTKFTPILVAQASRESGLPPQLRSIAKLLEKVAPWYALESNFPRL